MSQSSLEQSFSRLPPKAVVAIISRVARRIAPLIATTPHTYGNESWEWFNTADSSIRVTDGFAQGILISRFTLDLAAEMPRVAANAVAVAARRLGPSRFIEQAEIVFAVTAFAADAARAENLPRTAQIAARAAMIAIAGDYKVVEPMEKDLALLLEHHIKAGVDCMTSVDPTEQGPLGRLWSDDEPEGWTTAWTELTRRQVELPQIITLPGI